MFCCLFVTRKVYWYQGEHSVLSRNIVPLKLIMIAFNNINGQNTK